MVEKTRNPADRHTESRGAAALPVLAGLVAAVLGAVLWAVLAGVTGYTFPIVAVGIGLLHVATGSWEVPFLVLLGLVGLLLVAGWFACRPTMLGPEPAA